MLNWLKCCKHSFWQLQLALKCYWKSWKSAQLNSKFSWAANSHSESWRRKIGIHVPVNTNVLRHKKWKRSRIFLHLCEFTMFRTPAVTCELNHGEQGLQDDLPKNTLAIEYVCAHIYIYTKNLDMCPCVYINKIWFKLQCMEGMLSFNILLNRQETRQLTCGQQNSKDTNYYMFLGYKKQ